MDAKLTSWRCRQCRETNDSSFEICWNCGATLDGTPDPDFVPAVEFDPVCRQCGYLLIGLPEERCPECGTRFDPQARDTPIEVPTQRRHPIARLVAVMFVSTFVLSLLWMLAEFAGV